jgi:hypothetical protein
MANRELNLTPEQGRLLGQVYALIIELAREKRATQNQLKKSTGDQPGQSDQRIDGIATVDRTSHRKK